MKGKKTNPINNSRGKILDPELVQITMNLRN